MKRWIEGIMVACFAMTVWTLALAQDGSVVGDETAATLQLMIEMAIAGAGTFLATWIYKKELPKLGIKVSSKSLPWVARGFSVFGLGVWKVVDMGFSWKAIGSAAIMGLVAAFGASKTHDVGSALAGEK